MCTKFSNFECGAAGRPPRTIFIIAILLLEFATAQSQIKITLSDVSHGRNTGTIEVTGIDPEILQKLDALKPDQLQWNELLPVKTIDSISVWQAHPTILGAYAIEGDVIRFSPRFPLVPGVDYIARLNVSRLMALTQVSPDSVVSSAYQVHRFRIPSLDSQRQSQVRAIYPSAGELPENQLKFYIHFSAPMKRGDAYRFIQLIDETGRKVEKAFLEIEPELWDRESMRLTLLFDPGRIKRGLRPHKEMGMALQAEKSYRLVIDKKWPDNQGRSLAAGFEKSFKVVAADRIPPNHELWQVTSPGAGTMDPAIITFPEPMDHALLGRLINIFDSQDNAVDGRITISNQERQWEFRPEEPWIAGTHVVEVSTVIEDLAGNSLQSVFDAHKDHQEDMSGDRKFVRIPFQITDNFTP